MTAQWPVPAGLHRASIRLPIEGELPSSDGVTGWLNSAPLTAGGPQGRVVLVNFWIYTCINWLRQLPYVRAWNARYAAHGLVMVGVHTRVRVRERRRQHQPSSVGKGPTRDYTGATDQWQ
jgi:hypothetical protein